MNRILVSLVFVLSSFSFSQEASLIKSTAGGTFEPEVRGVSGCTVLWREEAKLRQYLLDHPEVLTAQRFEKRAWNFSVGDRHSWWATNLQTNTEYLVPSTCRAVGRYSYIFVEDSLWAAGRVNQAGVDSVSAAWEMRTPADPERGIYEICVETFGNPPDVDGDERIIILILDIKDGWDGSGTYIAGYFFSINQFPDGTGGRRSNFAEIYYVDGYPASLTTASGLRQAASTAAHEFQHMIHWNYDRSEITFVNESLSEVASLVCGYPYLGQAHYTDDTDVYLLGWSGTLADYARAARWGLYLWNQFPNGYLKLLVSNTGTGITGINGSLAQYSPATARRFDGIFRDWLVANYLNDPTVDPAFAYTFPGSLTKPKAVIHGDPNTGLRSASVQRLAGDYVTFNLGSGLAATFNSPSTSVGIKAIRIGPALKSVTDVPLGTAFSEPAFGTSITEVTFVILNSSQTSNATYSYEATGSATAAVELKWDTTEPQGYLLLSPRDTMVVTFDAVEGGWLDSVRVALRRAGSIRGGVWEHTGVLRPTPLGRPLAIPITASTTLTPPVINPGGPYPYEIPYPNWRTVDLRQYNIQTNKPFVVGFWLESDTTNDARLMITRYSSDQPHHSFTYLNSPSSGSPGWYFLSAGNEVIYLYLVRAYVSFTRIPTLPAAPQLLAPADGGVNFPTTLTLTWSASPGATLYRLQLSAASDFSSLLIDDSTLAATTREVGPLLPNTVYYWRVAARNAVGWSPFSAARSFTTAHPIPQTFALRQNYPNPFNPGTTIRYEVPVQSAVKLRVFNLLGEEVALLVDRDHAPGVYELAWEGTAPGGVKLPSGVYYCRMEADAFVSVVKMVLLR